MAEWNVRANDIFASALEMPPERRASYLERTCGSDSELLGQVEALLAAYALAGNFLDAPAIVAESDSPSTQPETSGSAPPLPAKAEELPARYELEEEIARGGMGRVLRGRDTELGREIAVKVLLETHQGRTELVQRFVEEARIAGQLQHPGIAPVYDLGALPGQRPWFTMKLVKGQTLAALLKQRQDSGQELPRFVGIFESVCQALAYAHSKKVIHRDLKPANIMVGAFGEVQVMDWGLAKVLDRDEESDEPTSVIHSGRPSGEDSGSGTQAGSVLGTPAYMARRGGKNSAAMRLARQADLAGAFARLDGCGADRELVALAKECLGAQPEGRPDNAGVVGLGVSAYLAAMQERLRASEISPCRRRGASRAKPRKGAAAGGPLSLVLILLVLAGGGMGWQVQQRQERRSRAQQGLADALQRGRALLQAGAKQHDREQLKLAEVESDRAVAIGRSGDVGPALQEDAGSLQEAVRGELARWRHNQKLLDALRDVSVPQETSSYQADDSGLMVALAQKSADEQYADAFRSWWRGLDGQVETRIVARLQEEPEPVVQEAVAALDAWMLDRSGG